MCIPISNRTTNMIAKILLVAGFCCSLLSAETYFPGNCQDYKAVITVVTEFSLAKYAGTWYEIARYPNNFDGNTDCKKVVYSIYNETTLRQIVTTKDLIKNEAGSQHGSISQQNGHASADFTASLNDVPENYEFQVVSTDYTTYSVVWGCKTLAPTVSLHQLNIFSRSTYFRLSSSFVVEEVLKSNNFDETKLRDTQQDAFLCSK